MAYYQTVEQAQADAAHMTGWLHVMVVEDPEPSIDGSPIIYIRALDPQTLRYAIFSSPDRQEPDHWL